MTTFLNYNTLVTNVIAYLAANSATINTGLTNQIQLIDEIDPAVYAVPNHEFPAISINCKTHTEESDDIGYERKRIQTSWEIGGHIRNYTSYQSARQEARLLLSNIEHALRQDPSLSATFHEFFVSSAEMDTIILEQDAFQINCMIFAEGINYV